MGPGRCLWKLLGASGPDLFGAHRRPARRAKGIAGDRIFGIRTDFYTTVLSELLLCENSHIALDGTHAHAAARLRPRLD